jgi:hypothetical protein
MQLQQLSNALGRWLSPFQRHLNWLVVGNTERDQVAALAGILERFPAEQVWWAGEVERSWASSELYSALVGGGIPNTQAEVGQGLYLGDGVTLRVLEIGEGGAALLVEWGSFH